MSAPDTHAANGTATRQVINRDRARTAPLRCASYAALSELSASPHELDPRPSLREKIGVGKTLEYAAGLDELLGEVAGADLGRLKSEYSSLFEVGSQGPPVPIREDLQTGQRGGTREDIVRFYNFFGYQLADKFAWAPDHLSVELEFVHFLCYQEAAAATDDDAISFQLAQVDFTERHLQRWLPGFAAGVGEHAAVSLYRRVISVLADFVVGDFVWQNSTISVAGEEATNG
jgi:DMSO reductase family type II enzyme chaperone